MLSPDDNSGVFTFLVGLIVIVMVGVGLSVVIDSRFQWNSSSKELKHQIDAYASELSNLKAYHDGQARRLQESNGKRKALLAERDQVMKNAGGHGGQSEALQVAKDSLLAEISAVENRFKDYRRQYRNSIWAASVGESLGTISISGGRDYNECSITKVTDAGLEIRHEHGFARIQAPDLSRELQDRFQWDDEERRQLLINEQTLQEKMASAGEDPKAKALTPRQKAAQSRAAEREKINALRDQVIAWKRKVRSIRSEYSTADSNARSTGRGNSVPGSLETWKAKAARMRGELDKANAELQVSKMKLRDVSPNDRLLDADIEP